MSEKELNSQAFNTPLSVAKANPNIAKELGVELSELDWNEINHG